MPTSHIVSRIEVKTADFSTDPGPRYISQGPDSGEKFRIEVLEPAFQRAIDQETSLHVDLDGVRGYGTSFLEEAFGGLVRTFNRKILDIISFTCISDSYYIGDIEEYIRDAEDALS